MQFYLNPQFESSSNICPCSLGIWSHSCLCLLWTEEQKEFAVKQLEALGNSPSGFSCRFQPSPLRNCCGFFCAGLKSSKISLLQEKVFILEDKIFPTVVIDKIGSTHVSQLLQINVSLLKLTLWILMLSSNCCLREVSLLFCTLYSISWIELSKKKPHHCLECWGFFEVTEVFVLFNAKTIKQLQWECFEHTQHILLKFQNLQSSL